MKKAKYDVLGRRPYNANMNTRSFAFDPFVSWHGAMNFRGRGTVMIDTNGADKN